jgi:hypothetical protein
MQGAVPKHAILQDGCWAMRSFIRSESGYALVLTLLFLPVFIGIGLLVIDLGRGNNAHSDHQAAADALALAGARELDGGTDAITRAKLAMAELDNSVSFLGLTGAESWINLKYADDPANPFNVIFLDDIPASDDTPIDQTWVNAHATNDGTEAEFVYVYSQAANLRTFFFNPVTRANASIPIAADAVATFSRAACDVTPLFMCNPFEGDATVGSDLQVAFAQGKLHGRLIQLRPKGSNTAFPGNFGFLSTPADSSGNANASASAIRSYFAGEYNPSCYAAETVTTKPGKAVSINQGINVRFDIYNGPYSNKSAVYPPAQNVRKGFIAANDCDPGPGGGGGGGNGGTDKQAPCTTWEYDGSDINDWALGFPQNTTTVPPGGTGAAPGSYIGANGWDLRTYWAVNHPGTPLTAQIVNDIGTQFPDAQSPGARWSATDAAALGIPVGGMPSRYEVYRYEIDSLDSAIVGDLLTDKSVGDLTRPANQRSATQERAAPIVGTANAAAEKDRRIIFVAIIDCQSNGGASGSTTFPVNSFASAFMVNPSINDPSDSEVDNTIDLEITDITGNGGNGTLDTFVRDEAMLVR